MELSRRNLVAGGLTAGGALGFVGSAWAEDEVSFPIRLSYNIPWTAVKIETHDPTPFRVETAARTLTIADTEAKRMGLKEVKQPNIVTGDPASAFKLVQYEAKTMVIGGALAMPANTKLTANLFARKTDLHRGGFEPCQGSPAMIDFLDGRVRFIKSIPNETRELEDIGYVQKEQGSLANPALRQGPMIHASVDGMAVKLAVDSANLAGITLGSKFVKANGLWSRPGVVRKGPLGQTKIVKGEVVQIGKHKFGAPVIALSDPEAADRPPGGAGQGADPMSAVGGRGGNEGPPRARSDGSIGIDLLRRFTLISDPRTGRFWVRPNAWIADGYRYDRAGVDIGEVNGALQVTEVAAGSPAETAGLKTGDKVTGWRGEGGYAGLIYALAGAPGSKVAIQIERDSGPMLVEITIQDRV